MVPKSWRNRISRIYYTSGTKYLPCNVSFRYHYNLYMGIVIAVLQVWFSELKENACDQAASEDEVRIQLRFVWLESSSC